MQEWSAHIIRASTEADLWRRKLFGTFWNDSTLLTHLQKRTHVNNICHRGIALTTCNGYRTIGIPMTAVRVVRTQEPRNALLEAQHGICTMQRLLFAQEASGLSEHV